MYRLGNYKKAQVKIANRLMVVTLLVSILVGCFSIKESSQINARDASSSLDEESTTEEIAILSDDVAKARTSYKVDIQTLLAASCAVQPKGVDRKGVDPCANKGVSALVEVLDSNEKLLHQMKSDSKGELSLLLAEGKYTFLVVAKAFQRVTRQTIVINRPRNISLLIRTKIDPR